MKIKYKQMIEKNCKKKYQCIYFIDVNLINGRAEDSRGATLSLLSEVDVNHRAQGDRYHRRSPALSTGENMTTPAHPTQKKTKYFSKGYLDKT